MHTMVRVMRRRGSPLSVGAILLLAATLGGAAAKSNAASDASSAFVINMPVGPATLDPADECGFTDLTITEATYGRLTQYCPTGASCPNSR
jgi:ABC-type oligopeptide transport system substrate-binding subunit